MTEVKVGRRRSGLASRRALCALVASVNAVACVAEVAPSAARPAVVAVYYPHWHTYDHGSAWNEWTEGQFLLPEAHYGSAHLEAIRKVFGTAKK